MTKMLRLVRPVVCAVRPTISMPRRYFPCRGPDDYESSYEGKFERQRKEMEKLQWDLSTACSLLYRLDSTKLHGVERSNYDILIGNWRKEMDRRERIEREEKNAKKSELIQLLNKLKQSQESMKAEQKNVEEALKQFEN